MKKRALPSFGKWFTSISRFTAFISLSIIPLTGYAQAPANAPINVYAQGTSPLHFFVRFTDTNVGEDFYDVHFTSATNPAYVEVWTVDSFNVPDGSVIETTASYDFGPGGTVYVKVRAGKFVPSTGDYVFGPFSETVTAIALENFPAPPSDFTAIAEVNQIRLTWTDNSPAGDPLDETTFNIMRDWSSTGEPGWSIDVPANTTSFVDTTVTPGTNYRYRLSAVNEFGHNYEIFFAEARALAPPMTIPMAENATFVSGNSFQANWSSVVGATGYRLYVYNTTDSAFLQGYNGMLVNDTTVHVTGTKRNRTYLYHVTAVNYFEETEASNVILVSRIKDLTLRSVCSADPEAFRRWKIINNNPIAVDVHWTVLATGQEGWLSALPGETFFTTSTATGSYSARLNYVLIDWTDDDLVEHTSQKSSTTSQCAIDTAIAGGAAMQEGLADEFNVTAYPNAVKDNVTLRISGVPGEKIQINIVDLYGKRIMSRIVDAGTEVQFDASGLRKGFYIVKMHHGNRIKTLRIFKE